MPKKAAYQFPAEIKQVTSRKTASLDVEFKVVFITHDPTVLNLGVIDADAMVDVTVELQ